MKDLSIILEDRPGTLADMGEALGKANINIEGACGFPCDGKGTGHLLVEDASTARRVLEEAGIKVGEEREVLVLEMEDQPGEFGKTARKIADAGVNINLMYTASGPRFVLGVDNLSKAKSSLE